MLTCLCCQSSNLRPLPYKDQFNFFELIECSECSHIQVSRMPSKEDIGRFYETYSQERAKFVSEPYFKIMEKRANSQQSFIEKFVNDKSLSVLDVGCGYGKLLKAANAFNRKSKGLEFDKLAINYAKKAGLDVESIQSEDEIEQYIQKSSIVVLSHVLEHLIDPNKTLDAINKKARYCFVEVPAYDANNPIQFVDQEGHLNFFTEKSLKVLVQKKFKVIEISSYGISVENFYTASKIRNFYLKVMRKITGDYFLNRYNKPCENGIWIRALLECKDIG